MWSLMTWEEVKKRKVLGAAEDILDDDKGFDKPEIPKGLVNALNNESRESIVGVGSFLFGEEVLNVIAEVDPDKKT